jgi:excisionase family DNA binding protein
LKEGSEVTNLVPQLYTPAEAAELLKVRESWLRRAVQARSIPHSRVGKHLRFSPQDLEAIVTAAQQPVVTSPIRRKAS